MRTPLTYGQPWPRRLCRCSPISKVETLATETRKGTRAKLERGEWAWAAPLGYRNPGRRTERGGAVSILEEDPITGRFKTCFDGASPHASGALVPYERLRGWV